MDLLAQGRMGSAGDVLMQRSKGMQARASGSQGELASAHELLPDSHGAVSSVREREVAARTALREAALKNAKLKISG